MLSTDPVVTPRAATIESAAYQAAPEIKTAWVAYVNPDHYSHVVDPMAPDAIRGQRSD